jgi:hypothetical protein
VQDVANNNVVLHCGWMALSPFGTSAATVWHRIDADAYKAKPWSTRYAGLGLCGEALLTGGTGGQMACRRYPG